MPELPEVQTIVDELKEKLTGKRITDVWGDWQKTFKQAGGLENFKKKTKNRKILNVRRRAKYIIIDIEGPQTILIHQKISGHLLYGKWVKRNKISNIKYQNDTDFIEHLPISSKILDKVGTRQSRDKSKFKNNQIWISKMPGPLKDDRQNQYIRVIFSLNNGWQLALSDLRRFGKIILIDDDKIVPISARGNRGSPDFIEDPRRSRDSTSNKIRDFDEIGKSLKEIKELGPEPLEISFNEFEKLFMGEAGASSEQGERVGRRFTRDETSSHRGNRLSERGRKGTSEAKSPPSRKRGRLKQVLMDPTFIAGIGNIYSDEILWDAGYHPLKRVEKLKEPDLKKIFNSTKKVLKTAIKYRGDSIDDYRLPSGEKGRYQEVQNAYQQTGKKCKKGDGGIIKRIKINGRSAHFCPVHQK